MEDVEDLLLQLEQELNEGKKSLFGGGVTVDAETIYGIIDRIRAALPEMIREAKYIVQTNEKRRQEETLRARFGEAHIDHIGPIMPGEDFYAFLDGRPGFFVELGSRCPEKGCDMPHHNPKYRLDQDALPYGVQYLYDMALALLNRAEQAED